MDRSGSRPAHPRPPFWVRVSIPAGNLIQIAGLVAGCWLSYLAARLDAGDVVRVLLMLVGWLLIYLCGHSFGHYVVGRLVGIRFSGYGIRGTDHPDDVTPVLRPILSALPMFTVMTEKASMRQASPLAKALMFAAGETATIGGGILVGLYAVLNGTPGGAILLIVSLLMGVIGVITTLQMPRGDYAKARDALRRRERD